MVTNLSALQEREITVDHDCGVITGTVVIFDRDRCDGKIIIDSEDSRNVLKSLFSRRMHNAAGEIEPHLVFDKGQDYADFISTRYSRIDPEHINGTLINASLIYERFESFYRGEVSPGPMACKVVASIKASSKALEMIGNGSGWMLTLRSIISSTSHKDRYTLANAYAVDLVRMDPYKFEPIGSFKSVPEPQLKFTRLIEAINSGEFTNKLS